MKCDNCGFIFNGDFDKCPYCGTVQNAANKNILHASVPLGHHNSVRVRTILNIFFLNIFLFSFFVDWLVFNFQYRLTFFSFVVCFGAILILSILYAFKSPLAVYERADFYCLVALIIASVSAQYGGLDLRAVFGFVVMPIYLFISSFVAVIMMLLGRGNKFRPIMTEWSMLSRLVMSTACLAVFLVGLLSNKYCSWVIVEDIVVLQKIAVFGAFGITVLTFLNFNVVLFLSIYNKVKYIYGK